MTFLLGQLLSNSGDIADEKEGIFEQDGKDVTVNFGQEDDDDNEVIWDVPLTDAQVPHYEDFN